MKPSTTNTIPRIPILAGAAAALIGGFFTCKEKGAPSSSAHDKTDQGPAQIALYAGLGACALGIAARKTIDVASNRHAEKLVAELIAESPQQPGLHVLGAVYMARSAMDNFNFVGICRTTPEVNRAVFKLTEEARSRETSFVANYKVQAEITLNDGETTIELLWISNNDYLGGSKGAAILYSVTFAEQSAKLTVNSGLWEAKSPAHLATFLRTAAPEVKQALLMRTS